MSFDIQCLVEVPEYLGLNLDKQIVPRFKVIDHLRSNGGLGDEVSRLKFYNLYVRPYPELEKVYGLALLRRSKSTFQLLGKPFRQLSFNTRTRIKPNVTSSTHKRMYCIVVEAVTPRELVPCLFRDEPAATSWIMVTCYESSAGSPDDDRGLLLREQCIVYGLT
ncbi:hypothetical protein F511_15055 [Dorcoceras hygrometricum]|uniref:Uncharacterized protein n=1 Tax=Dorcoceras hygrometricum TaxID=472368 RepID=A0A2Z7BYN0_9LAMI|nr:hypothetical protein F511_15055 [Dorcoceras hygrometricum]